MAVMGRNSKSWSSWGGRWWRELRRCCVLIYSGAVQTDKEMSVCVSTATWITEGASQLKSPLLWPVKVLTTMRMEVHMNAQLTSKFSLFLFPLQPLIWSVSDNILTHMEINRPALQYTLCSVWNCFYRFVCWVNNPPIFLQYSNSCQSDKRLFCLSCCWCCRWKPQVLLLQREEGDGGMEIGVSMEI